jgi:hypothetical protein
MKDLRQVPFTMAVQRNTTKKEDNSLVKRGDVKNARQQMTISFSCSNYIELRAHLCVC